MTLTITPLFIALFVLMNIVLLFPIGPYRLKVKTPFWGGEERLDKLVRGHGNFIEYVPITLMAMGAAELVGALPLLLWGCGAALLAGRILHYASIQVMGAGRLIGTLISMSVMLVLALSILYQLYIA